MSRLSQLNKADAHKALAALAQRQQGAAAAQFDGEAAFAAILNAQSNQISSQPETIDGNAPRGQQDRKDSQDDAQQARPDRALDHPAERRAIPSKTAQRESEIDKRGTRVDAPAAHVTQPSDGKPAAPAKTDLQQVKQAKPEPDAPDDDDLAAATKADEAAPIIEVTTDQPAVATTPILMDAVPVIDLPQPLTVPVDAVDTLPTAVAVQVPLAEPQITPLHMLLALSSGQAAPPPVAVAQTATPQVLPLVPQATASAKPVAATAPMLPEIAAPALPAVAQPQAQTQVQAPLDAPLELLSAAQPATPADIKHAAAIVLQQLAPMTAAIAEATPQPAKANPQPLTGFTAAATQAEFQPVPQAFTQPATAPIADTTPAPFTPNPLLAPIETQATTTATPQPNPFLQAPTNPVMAATPAVVSTHIAASAQVDSHLGNNGTIDTTIEGAAFGNHTLARYDTGALAKSNRLANTATGASLPANVQVAVQLARAARNGDRAFNIQLHPAELGRVEVKLDVDSHGGATARILVDSQATLDLLQTHKAGLERALTDAGLQCDTGGISFDLRDSGQSNQHQQASGRQSAKNNTPAALSGTADASLDTSIIANYTLRLEPGRIDIKA